MKCFIIDFNYYYDKISILVSIGIIPVVYNHQDEIFYHELKIALQVQVCGAELFYLRVNTNL